MNPEDVERLNQRVREAQARRRGAFLWLLRERWRLELLRRTDEWHEGDYPGPLCEYLGMTEEQYSRWVAIGEGAFW